LTYNDKLKLFREHAVEAESLCLRALVSGPGS
jgi:hypothetical protein